MLIKPTQERLRAMRLGGMAEAFATQMQDAGAAQLSFEERFSLMVDHEWLARQNRALQRRLLLGPITSADHHYSPIRSSL